MPDFQRSPYHPPLQSPRILVERQHVARANLGPQVANDYVYNDCQIFSNEADPHPRILTDWDLDECDGPLQFVACFLFDCSSV